MFIFYLKENTALGATWRCGAKGLTEQKMEETSCELWDEIFEDGSVKYIEELNVCVASFGGEIRKETNALV